uniref:Uncharacterized protein n=1 Tax=Anopheles coluzzii TaxID=1518534 RepID=A0A8W7PU26_ANOCL
MCNALPPFPFHEKGQTSWEKVKKKRQHLPAESSCSRFRDTSDSGSLLPTSLPPPLPTASSTTLLPPPPPGPEWVFFCASSTSRSCCWCSRFLIRKIFGMLLPVRARGRTHGAARKHLRNAAQV